MRVVIHLIVHVLNRRRCDARCLKQFHHFEAGVLPRPVADVPIELATIALARERGREPWVAAPLGIADRVPEPLPLLLTAHRDSAPPLWAIRAGVRTPRRCARLAIPRR